MASKFAHVQLPDWLKATITAVLGAVITTVYQAMTQGGFAAINWEMALEVGVTAGLSELIRRFFTTKDGATFGIAATKPK